MKAVELMCSQKNCWRKIAVTLIDEVLSANAWLQELTLFTPQRIGVSGPTAIEAAIAASRTLPWLLSG